MAQIALVGMGAGSLGSEVDPKVTAATMLLALGGGVGLAALKRIPVGRSRPAAPSPAASSPAASPAASGPAAPTRKEPEVHATRRERQVLGLVNQGLRNLDVAERLGISERTVRVHLENLTRKLGANSRVDLMRLARRAGWLK